MNVVVKETIIVMTMPSVQTHMVALHVNVKMDTQEMEQHVMVNGIIMYDCQIHLSNKLYLLFLILN